MGAEAHLIILSKVREEKKKVRPAELADDLNFGYVGSILLVRDYPFKEFSLS